VEGKTDDSVAPRPKLERKVGSHSLGTPEIEGKHANTDYGGLLHNSLHFVSGGHSRMVCGPLWRMGDFKTELF
jgi:hypothetical protein